jgi:hypothetical protein
MPYPGVNKKAIPKLDRCVIDVMKQGHEKDSAIAICRASLDADELDPENITGETQLEASTELPQTEEPKVRQNTGLQLEEPSQVELDLLIAGSKSPGRVMVFRNAVLARCERNKNGDGLTSDALRELAETLPLMPIDIDHQRNNILGMFTSASVGDWVKNDGTIVNDGTLYANGVIFSDSKPVETQEIVDGARKLSISAKSAKIVCSKCNKVAVTKGDYCEHMKDPNQSGATRYRFGMTAIGAGTTKKPAGTDTVFDPTGMVVIASIEFDATEENRVNIDELKAEVERLMALATQSEAKIKECEASIAQLIEANKTLSETVSRLETEKSELASKLQDTEAAKVAVTEQSGVSASRAITLTELFGAEKAKGMLKTVSTLNEEQFTMFADVATNSKPKPQPIVVAGDNEDEKPVTLENLFNVKKE